MWQQEEVGEPVLAAREQGAGRDALWLQHDATGDGSYEAFLGNGSTEDVERPVDPASPVLMLYTAAFEGRPRGALISHSALLHQALVVALIQRVDHDYTYLNSGPLFHIATLMTTAATFHLGGTNVFTRRSDPAEMLRLIEEERCNGAFLLHPTVKKMGELNADGRHDLSSLVTMKMGVAGFDEAISQESTPWLRKPGGYGQTECTGIVAYSAFSEGGSFSSGRASPVARVRIVDPDGAELPPGETGEIVVRGPVVMNGYLGAADATAERRRGDWHHTNDLGRREPDGTVTFVGPKTRLIKSAAENIYPAEVEACLSQHPAVREAAIIGVPDPTWGQNVKAIVVLHDGQAATENEIIDHCRERIASYKKPKTVEFVPSLPRTSTYALDRDALDAAHGGGGYPGTA